MSLIRWSWAIQRLKAGEVRKQEGRITCNNKSMRLNAKELRNYQQNPSSSFDKLRTSVGARRNPIYIIVDNVLDTYNIGSIFRLADAVAATRILICGESLTPPHTRIKKASINTTEFVEWEYHKSVKSAIQNLKIKMQNYHRHGGIPLRRDNSKLKIIAIEQNKKSIPYDKAKYSFPVALVVGNESYGISKEVLKMCDEIVELPMWGVNRSLNVVVSLGIVLYEVMKGQRG